MAHTTTSIGENGQRKAATMAPLSLSERHCKMVLQGLLAASGGVVDWEALCAELDVTQAWAEELIRRLIAKGHVVRGLVVRV